MGPNFLEQHIEFFVNAQWILQQHTLKNSRYTVLYGGEFKLATAKIMFLMMMTPMGEILRFRVSVVYCSTGWPPLGGGGEEHVATMGMYSTSLHVSLSPIILYIIAVT